MSRKRPGVSISRYSANEIEALSRAMDSQLFMVAAILATTQPEELIDMDEAVDDALTLKQAILERLT